MPQATSPAAGHPLPISTAKPAREYVGSARNNSSTTPHVDTVAALGHDIAQRVLQLQREDEDLPGREHLARIIIHSLLSLPDDGLADLVEEPARLGDLRWDALLQGLVAWRCRDALPAVPVPAWATQVHLDVAWAPFGGSIRDDAWYTLSVLSTPAALLHRGIVLDRRNLKEL